MLSFWIVFAFATNVVAAIVNAYVAWRNRQRMREPVPLYLLYRQEAERLIQESGRRGTSIYEHERNAAREMLEQAQAFTKLALRQHDAPPEVRAMLDLSQVE